MIRPKQIHGVNWVPNSSKPSRPGKGLRPLVSWCLPPGYLFDPTAGTSPRRPRSLAYIRDGCARCVTRDGLGQRIMTEHDCLVASTSVGLGLAKGLLSDPPFTFNVPLAQRQGRLGRRSPHGDTAAGSFTFPDSRVIPHTCLAVGPIQRLSRPRMLGMFIVVPRPAC